MRQRSGAEITAQVHRLVCPEAREFDPTPEPQWRARVQAGLAELQLRADNPLQHEDHRAKPVPVALLGLWDTAEALGAPSWLRRMLHKLGV